MDIFVVMRFIECEDRYYGCSKDLQSVYSSFEEAKSFIDRYVATNKYCGGKRGDDYLEIIRMKMGDAHKEVVYNSLKEFHMKMRDDQIFRSVAEECEKKELPEEKWIKVGKKKSNT
jgi:hypothetical protein